VTPTQDLDVLQVQNIKKKFLVLSLASGEARVGGSSLPPINQSGYQQ
jgi:hypothetical protein